jgi:hypothetical protein
MEDGIETYRVSIFNNFNTNKEKVKIDEKEFIYIYTPEYGDIVIIHNKKKAIEYSKEMNCKISIFEKEIKCFYKPTNEFYLNGVHYIEINNH